VAEAEQREVSGLTVRDVLTREALHIAHKGGHGWETFPTTDAEPLFTTAAEVGAKLISDLKRAGRLGIQLGEPSWIGNPTFRDPNTGDALLHVAVYSQQYVHPPPPLIISSRHIVSD
jgi:hypothetical protein